MHSPKKNKRMHKTTQKLVTPYFCNKNTSNTKVVTVTVDTYAAPSPCTGMLAELGRMFGRLAVVLLMMNSLAALPS